MNHSLSIREIQPDDIRLISDYWLTSDPDFMVSMGVDLDKLPTREGLANMLTTQIHAPIEEKMSYALIWEVDEKPVGHSNVNGIEFGKEAFMHLHLWQYSFRKKGIGTELVKKSLPWFFEKLKLEVLYSEPYALNPAPSKTLERVGFEFVKEYITIPGSLNFEQPVKRWKMSRERYMEIFSS